MNMKAISEKDFFRSSDLCLSAVISMDYPVEELDKTYPGKVIFLFRRENGLDEVVRAFWDGKLQIEPRAYFDAIKSLKTRIYQE
jgi:hypothetical protein